MKLKALTASIISLSLTACATQSMHAPQEGLDEKVYAGYEQLIGKQSYAFDGEVRFNLQSVPPPKKALNPIVQKELNQLATQHKLSTTERQWLDEGIAAEQDSYPANSKYDRIVTLLNRGYMQFDGVVDIGHGQFSINPKIGYSTKNAQAWVGVPLALDLRQSKIYADLSALSPMLIDPQYDGRYMMFDYSNYAKLLKERHLDVKPFMLLLKQYILLDPALSTAQDYQTQALTANDKQKGGALRLSYHTNYQRMIQKQILFLYLNQPYVAKLLAASSDKVDVLQSGMKQLTASSSGDATTASNTALAAKERLKEAVNAMLRSSATEDTDRIEDPATKDQRSEQAQLDLINLMILGDVKEESLKQQLKDSLKAFDQYKTGELISAKQVKKIVAEQPEAYAKLGQLTQQLFEDSLYKLVMDAKISTDMVLDAKGRFIRADSKMTFSGLPEYGIGEITGSIKYNIHDYGKARVDAKALQQAVPYKQAIKNQTALPSLNKLLNNTTSSSENWSKEKRYQELGRSLLAKNKTKFEIYHSVLWYASLVEQQQDLEAEQSQQLQQAVLFASLYHADEAGWHLTTQQKKQLHSFNQQDLSTELLSDSAIYYVDRALETVFKELDLQQSMDKWRKQGKSTAQIFASLYEQLERNASGMSATKSHNQNWLALFNVLGQVAAQDLKTQKIDPSLLQNLDEKQLLNVDFSIYQQVYQFMLEHR